MRSAWLAAAGGAMILGSGAAAAPITIHAGRLLAVPGQAGAGASTIVVDNGRIVSVTAGYQPAAGQLIDLRDKTVLPGLIDAMSISTATGRAMRACCPAFTESVPLRTYEAQWNGMKTLRAGFTTVRNLGDGEAASALRCATPSPAAGCRDRASSPRRRASPTTAGHMDGRNGTDDWSTRHRARPSICATAPADCRRAVRLQISRGADVIKIATTGGVNSGIGAGLGRRCRRRSRSADRDRPRVRQEGCGPRTRTRRHQAGAAQRRRFDRAWHR